MKNRLDVLIDNTYENVRLTGDQQQKIAEFRTLLIEYIEKILKNAGLTKNIDYEIMNQGSYATHTQIVVPYNDNLDFDVDIGINFFNKKFIGKKKPQTIRNYLYSCLIKEPLIEDHFKFTRKTSKCISFNLKNEFLKKIGFNFPNLKIRYEICIYKQIKENTYFGRETDWSIDDKKTQMIALKEKMADNNEIRKIIIFLKCFVSGHKIFKIFKSIIIVEFAVQYYDEKYEMPLSIHIINMLRNFIRNLKKEYVLHTSGITRENLLCNDYRNLSQDEFIPLIELLCSDFENIVNQPSINTRYILNYDDYHKSNYMMIMLPCDIKDSFLCIINYLSEIDERKNIDVAEEVIHCIKKIISDDIYGNLFTCYSETVVLYKKSETVVPYKKNAQICGEINNINKLINNYKIDILMPVFKL